MDGGLFRGSLHNRQSDDEPPTILDINKRVVVYFRVCASSPAFGDEI